MHQTDIAISRVAAWENFEVRRHELRKVYANSTDCLDLFIVGIATVKPNGRDQETLEFIVRTVVQDTSEGLRIKYFQPLIPNPSNQPILADVQK